MFGGQPHYSSRFSKRRYPSCEGQSTLNTESDSTTNYQYDANNRLLQEGAISYHYDNNGNLTEKHGPEEEVVYNYSAENRLTRVDTTKHGVTIAVDYEYDADGNRTRKMIDGNVVINYLVDTNRPYAQVVEERDGEGNLLVRYVYGHDLISQTRDSITSYYHYDGLGSTRALSSSAGIVTDEYCYDAFGNLLDKTGNTPNEYLYTGEFFDSHLGFYYLRARYMNPRIGRFVTMDSFAGIIRDPYSLHKYLYAHANPVNMIDPSGHMSSYAEITVAGSIIGAMSGIYVYHVTHAPDDRTATGYVTWGTGGGLIGGLLAQGAWYIWLKSPAVVSVATAPLALSALTESTKELLLKGALKSQGAGTAVGKALQKHASRSWSWLKALGHGGNHAKNTETGRKIIEYLLNRGNVTTAIHKDFGEVIKVRLSDGAGAWWTKSGKFIGFLEKYTPRKP